ncbi:MAG: ABC transporter ATP-binding protein [Anaerolineae bacterium]|nr:ABC transporter ATP-binding protein [Anaerolineae bacterium]
MAPIIELNQITKYFGSKNERVTAVDAVSLAIEDGEIVCLVGESGCGKSTTGRMVVGLLSPSAGEITYKGRDISAMGRNDYQAYRRAVQIIHQDPYASLNPTQTVRQMLTTPLLRHKKVSGSTAADRRAAELLEIVDLTPVEDFLNKYPHQLSGGQRQRIMMARAYMVKPKLIVADEPVSMVDASLRASILDVMIRLKEESNISFLYITHDLSTAYQIGDKIMLLYQGTVSEIGNATDVIDSPKHPYVQLLVDSVPKPDPNIRWEGEIVLPPEEEMRTSHKQGCRFYPRCPHRMDHCLNNLPPLYSVGDRGHEASCYLYDEKVVATEA